MQSFGLPLALILLGVGALLNTAVLAYFALRILYIRPMLRKTPHLQRSHRFATAHR